MRYEEMRTFFLLLLMLHFVSLLLIFAVPRIQVKYCINAFNYACRSMLAQQQLAMRDRATPY